MRLLRDSRHITLEDLGKPPTDLSDAPVLIITLFQPVSQLIEQKDRRRLAQARAYTVADVITRSEEFRKKPVKTRSGEELLFLGDDELEELEEHFQRFGHSLNDSYDEEVRDLIRRFRKKGVLAITGRGQDERRLKRRALILTRVLDCLNDMDQDNGETGTKNAFRALLEPAYWEARDAAKSTRQPVDLMVHPFHELSV
jgi:hypothetical protein